MNEEIIKYLQSCQEYQKNKPGRHQFYGLLQLLELAFSLWSSIAIDFITDLHLSNGCDQLWVIIYLCTKMVYFILLIKKEKEAKNLVLIFPCDNPYVTYIIFIT
jgi:hypothetical protein